LEIIDTFTNNAYNLFTDMKIMTTNSMMMRMPMLCPRLVS